MAALYISLITHIAVAIVCFLTYYRAADMENGQASPLLWALASLALYLVTWLLLGWGWFLLILSQLALAFLIAIARSIAYWKQTRP